MDRDIRETPLYKEIEEQFRGMVEPAIGVISSVVAPEVSPDETTVAFTGGLLENLEGTAAGRACLADLRTGELRGVSSGPNSDQSPHWSPDGSTLAFLSDRVEKGQFLLYLAEPSNLTEPRPTAPVEGTVEYHGWSPDGRSILLGVAGRGADLAGGQGSGVHKAQAEELPSWMPTVDSGVAEHQWRRLHLLDVESNTVRTASREELNVWEAVWAGPDHALAIISEHPGEGAWYTAPLALIDLASGQERVLYRSDWQLGVPAASPSGSRLAVIEAVSSDRMLLAGNLLLISPETGEPTLVPTNGMDVTFITWRDEDRLLYAGLRGFETVVGEYDALTGNTLELWSTREGAGVYFPGVPQVSPLGEDGFVLTRDSFERYPEIAAIEDGQARTVRSFAHEGAARIRAIGGRLEEVSWTAPDGLEMGGYLILPPGPGPYPLVMSVHGGPVYAFGNHWPSDHRVSLTPLLLSRGYAIFLPNPRGSAGRGQEFIKGVYGDMGGKDTQDILSGVDALVERGIADPQRIGVTGGSYGGFMSSWLVTQTDRFAAAVPMSPVTNWYSFHWTSNIPYFDEIFLQDSPTNPTGLYFQRSPVMFAGNVRTPTLNIAGARDRCTPPTQAQEFHNALLEHGVESELVIYPEEGHGVRTMPASIDLATRVIGWFERHMPAKVKEEELSAASS